MLSHFSHVRLFVIYGPWPARLLCPWGFSRQEYWSGLPCPPLGDFLTQGLNPCLLCPLHLQAGYRVSSLFYRRENKRLRQFKCLAQVILLMNCYSGIQNQAQPLCIKLPCWDGWGSSSSHKEDQGESVITYRYSEKSLLLAPTLAPAFLLWKIAFVHIVRRKNLITDWNVRVLKQRTQTIWYQVLKVVGY